MLMFLKKSVNELNHRCSNLHADSSSITIVVPASFRASRVEIAVLENVDRDVENIGVIVKGLLDAISCVL
jgi:hypothetical protein